MALVQMHALDLHQQEVGQVAAPVMIGFVTSPTAEFALEQALCSI